MRDVTSTVGRWLIVKHKHDDYASTALILVNVTNTTKLYGDEKEKEMLVFVYMVYTHFLNVKIQRASSIYRCFTILRSHECGTVYTRFLTIIWWRKTGMLNFF